MGGVQPITVPQPLAYAIDRAGDKSAVDFDYLLQTAIRESSLDPSAKAGSSSATGLFQFLDATWLRVMKQEGPRLGYQDYADAIKADANGELYVSDKAVRAEILKLREDPQISADLAAAFTASNGAYLQQKFGRMPSPGELYIAHFLGAQGAEKLFRAGLADPDQSAAALFPRQAKANPTIFYDGSGARSVREVYRVLVAKHDSAEPAGDPRFLAQQMTTGPLVSAPGGSPLLTSPDTGPLVALSGERWSRGGVPSRYGPDGMAPDYPAAGPDTIPGRVLMSPSQTGMASADAGGKGDDAEP